MASSWPWSNYDRKAFIVKKQKFFDCGNSFHNHKNESVARKCRKKRESSASRAPLIIFERDVYANALARYKRFEDPEKICADLMINRAALRRVVGTAKLLATKGGKGGPVATLSARLLNSLICEDVRTIDQAMSALSEGKLNRVPNIGDVSKSELRDWLLSL